MIHGQGTLHPHDWIALLANWAQHNQIAAMVMTVPMVALIATLDYSTGYESRLSIIYLVPIALATWSGGLRSGFIITVLADLTWLASFSSSHQYSGDFYFYWEGLAMLAVHIAFVFLLQRLRFVLAQADERFLRVLEELHAAVFVTDQDNGEILYANRSLEQLIKTDPRKLNAMTLGQHFGLGDFTQKPDRDRFAEPSRAGFVTREIRSPNDGRWYLVQTGPIPWKSSRRVCVQVITDISAQKRTQALKQQHQDMLHQTARLAALAEISSSLAHEVNQPLMAIASYNDACLRMLNASLFDKNEVITALQRCREQALRAGKIISRVRDFLRSKQPTPTLCNVNSLVCESLEFLETQLEDGEVSTELLLSDTLPMTQADQTLLIQVIVNLVQNAIDAMAQSIPAHRNLLISTAKTNENAIIVSVTDQGTGIPAEITQQLFTPLFTTKAQGMGLGLAICRSVVEAHGGRIWHSANLDGGSTFHFTLPPETSQ